MGSTGDLELRQNLTVCLACRGRGKKSKGLSNKAKKDYQIAMNQFEEAGFAGIRPVFPQGHLFICKNCAGSGLVYTDSPIPEEAEKYPHVAIIGAGIAGVALAVACLHRGIPFTLYERDRNFDVRAQGYGLTLQQARKAMDGFGVFELGGGVVSTRHMVHTIEGKVVGEWGGRKYLNTGTALQSKRNNIHIARQSLRLELLGKLGGSNMVQWGHQLVDLKEVEGEGVRLTFLVDGRTHVAKTNLVVGADGVRSTVRRLALGESITPLRYLGCIVILGICSLDKLSDIGSPLLDGSTVFQTANGNERIYVMPYTKDSVMWQLSFPMLEEEAKGLSGQGAGALKEEACRRTLWHSPIPEIIAGTAEEKISGYPVYDRELLTAGLLRNLGSATIIGDAAHPMSPFKGQGANQALLDALALARTIYKNYQFVSLNSVSVRTQVLTEFETHMLERSATKVRDSADAAQFLHSAIVLEEGDQPRGSCFKKRTI